jgi:hypothetical protein
MRLLKQCLPLIMICLLGGQAQAQELNKAFEPQYFPPKLMHAEDVKVMHMYQHDQLNPGATTGHTIRLAKEKTESAFFNVAGDVTLKEVYGTGERAHNVIQISYNEKGQMTQKSYEHFTPANTLQPDSAWMSILKTATHYTYDGDQLQSQRSLSIPNGDMLQSIEFGYYPDGRIQAERKSSGKRTLTRTYFYKDNTVLIEERNEEALIRSERLELDQASRVLTHAYIPAGATIPDLTEIYTYNAQGWLEELRYEFDWQKHERATVLLSRKNRYDDRGKLTESTFDYGDGRQITQWFDYEYWGRDNQDK